MDISAFFSWALVYIGVDIGDAVWMHDGLRMDRIDAPGFYA